MHKKYIVRLAEQERQACTEVMQKLQGSAPKVRRAQSLLQAAVEGPAWTDGRIAEAFKCRGQTIENLRKRLGTAGWAGALEGKKRATPPPPPRRDGPGEAQLMALRLGKPPAGYGRWTWQLVADELVALEVVASISIETGRQTLQKTG